MDNHLITPRDIGILARPCDADDEAADRAIEEAELLDVIPTIGASIFTELATNGDIGVLLSGGLYIGDDERECIFPGLRVALAYYAWARVVKASVARVTRFGFVSKNDDYSHAAEAKDRQIAYNDAFAVADGYMRQCLAYIAANKVLFERFSSSEKCIKTSRTIFKVIGD